MSDTGSASVFREEALAHRDREPGPGTLPRITPPWTRWAYRALLGFVAAGTAAGLLVDVDENASGPVIVEGDGIHVMAVLPEAARAALERDGRFAVHLGGTPGTEVTARLLTLDPVDHATAVQRFGTGALGGLVAPSTSLLAAGGLLPGSLGRPTVHGALRVEVRVGSRPLLLGLLSGLVSGGAG